MSHERTRIAVSYVTQLPKAEREAWYEHIKESGFTPLIPTRELLNLMRRRALVGVGLLVVNSAIELVRQGERYPIEGSRFHVRHGEGLPIYLTANPVAEPRPLPEPYTVINNNLALIRRDWQPAAN